MSDESWSQLPVAEVGRIVTGKTPPTARAELFGSDFPFITPTDMDGRKVIRRSERGLSQKGAAFQKSLRLPARSVLVSCIGWQMGKVALSDSESFTNQQINAVLPNSARMDTDFLYYFLSTRREELKRLGSVGTRTPILNKTRFGEIQVPVPPLPTQREIASILSAYDDLIENNTRRIQIFEEMARSIYQEWFVNFRFPGHKNVKIVESELGPIPEGWDVGKLEDGVVLQRGFDLPRDDRRDGSVPVYAATGVVGYHDQSKVTAPGVVTGRSGSIGTVMYITEDFWPLNTTLWAKEFRRFSPAVAFYVLSRLDLGTFNAGSAVPTLNRNHVHNLPTLLPPFPLVMAFQAYMEDVFNLRVTLLHRNRILRQTRDLLLPKLISGEVDVSELDIQTEVPVA